VTAKKIAQKRQRQTRSSKPTPNKRKPASLWKRRFWVGTGLLGVAALSAMGGALLALSLSAQPLRPAQLAQRAERIAFDERDPVDTPSLQLPGLTRPINVLILGTKADTPIAKRSPERSNEFGGNTDTILLARFEPGSDELTLLSVPRDTRTRIEGLGTAKINAANAEGGAALAAREVRDLLGGVAIDRYVRLNLQGVETLVDALGGVTVYVPKDMHYTDRSQDLRIDLEQGKQHLDGDKALQFLRFRHDGKGDIGRIQRQQILLRAILDKALNPTTLVRAPQIVSAVRSHVDTNLSVEEMIALAGFATKTDTSDVQMVMLPGRVGSGTVQSDSGQIPISYWIPDESKIPALMARYFNAPRAVSSEEEAPEPANVRVAVQNGAEQAQGAIALKRALQRQGYRQSYLDDGWDRVPSRTRILAQHGNEQAARAVRQALGLGIVRVQSTGPLNADVTVRIGQDWLQRQRVLPSAPEASEASAPATSPATAG